MWKVSWKYPKNISTQINIEPNGLNYHKLVFKDFHYCLKGNKGEFLQKRTPWRLENQTFISKNPSIEGYTLLDSFGKLTSQSCFVCQVWRKSVKKLRHLEQRYIIISFQGPGLTIKIIWIAKISMGIFKCLGSTVFSIFVFITQNQHYNSKLALPQASRHE